MNELTDTRTSLASTASWASLGLALWCGCMFFVFQMVDQVLPFEKTVGGVLTGFVPRTALYVLWAGEALASVIGIVSLLFIRRTDIASSAIIGIVVRSLCGIAIGLVGGLIMWLIVGHIVIGF